MSGAPVNIIPGKSLQWSTVKLFICILPMKIRAEIHGKRFSDTV